MPRRLLIIGAVIASALVAPAAAQACGSQRLAQPLAALGDAGWYLPMENAGFERGTTDWRLRGATVVAGNEPWKVSGPRDRGALRLAQGGTALSDEVCVTLAHTHARFFARPLTAGAVLRVDVLWDNNGDDYEATVLTLQDWQAGAWGLSPVAPIAEWVRSLYEDERDELVAVRFSAVAGQWEIDDVLVDPYRSR